MTGYDETKEEIALLNNFYEYLKKNPNDCIMDTIKEFCGDYDIEYEYIGYLISQNKDLKDYAEANLKKFKFIRPQNAQKSQKSKNSGPSKP